MWQVANATSGEAYEILPGPDDGVATASPDWPFPQGDLWALRYRGAEIDHGVQATGPPYEANLDSWVNGEAVDRQDVVVWYAGHVTHDVAAEPPGHFGHSAGPELRPHNWLYTPVKAVPGWFGWENQGGGVAIADLSSSGRPT